MKKTTIQHLLVCIFFFILTLCLTYPSISTVSTKIIGDGVDTIEYYSYFLSTKDNISKRNPPFWFSPIYRYPTGINTSLSESRIFVISGALLTFFISSILAYNILIYLIFITNGFLSYLFYRSLTNNWLLGVLGGILNGFSFWVILNGYGAINVFQMFAYPVVCIIFLDIARKGLRSIHLYYVSLSTYLVALNSTEGLLMGIIGALCSCLLLLFIKKDFLFKQLKELKKQIFHIFLSFFLFIVLYIITFPFHINRLLTMDFPSSGAFFAGPKTPISSLFFPPGSDYNTLLFEILKSIGITLPTNAWWWETSYIGFGVIALLILSLKVFSRSKQYVFFLVSTILYFFFILMGHFYKITSFPNIPKFLFYPFVYMTDNHLFFIMIFWVFATSAIVVSLKILKVRKTVIIALCMFFSFERLNTGYPTVDINFLRGVSYAKVVSTLPGKAVLDIPLDTHTAYNLLPFEYKKPIVAGMIHWFGDGKAERKFINEDALSLFSCGLVLTMGFPTYKIDPYRIEQSLAMKKKLITILKTHNINTIVIHKKWFYLEKCLSVRQQTAMLVTDLTPEEARISENIYNDIEELNYVLPNDVKRIFSNEDVIIYQLL